MLSADLKMFTGTEQWFRHPLSSNFLYTDGVKFFAEHCGGGAYWFLLRSVQQRISHRQCKES